jgi:CheY-like chemotaxis protein
MRGRSPVRLLYTPGVAAASILVAEDDDDLRELLKLALEGQGYDVATAANGIEALVRLAQPSRPDALLLNLWMPLVPGDDVLDVIRQEPRLASLPVIILTGGTVPTEVARSADAVFGKPFDMDALLATLDAAVRSAPCPGPPAG